SNDQRTCSPHTTTTTVSYKFDTNQRTCSPHATTTTESYKFAGSGRAEPGWPLLDPEPSDAHEERPEALSSEDEPGHVGPAQQRGCLRSVRPALVPGR